MKNLLLSLFGLAFCAALSISTFAESDEIQYLASFTNDYNKQVYVMSVTVAEDNKEIEKIHIESFDKGNFLEKKTSEIKSFLQDGFKKTLKGTKVLSVQLVDFDPEKGGLFGFEYLEDFWTGTHSKIELSLHKNEEVWMLTDKSGQRVDILKIIIKKRAFLPVGVQHINTRAMPFSQRKIGPSCEELVRSLL